MAGSRCICKSRATNRQPRGKSYLCQELLLLSSRSRPACKIALPVQEFHLNSFSAWPFFSLPPGSVCLLRSPPSNVTWVQITPRWREICRLLSLLLASSGACKLPQPDPSRQCRFPAPPHRSCEQSTWTKELETSIQTQESRWISVHTAKTCFQKQTNKQTQQQKHHHQAWALQLCHLIPPPLWLSPALEFGTWIETPRRILHLSRSYLDFLAT